MITRKRKSNDAIYNDKEKKTKIEAMVEAIPQRQLDIVQHEPN
jgi:hypothetical protein